MRTREKWNQILGKSRALQIDTRNLIVPIGLPLRSSLQRLIQIPQDILDIFQPYGDTN